MTQDKRSSVVATGLFGLGTFNQASLSPPNIEKALSFLLAHQDNKGYWEDTSSFSWNKVEATTAALYGLISAGSEGESLEKGMDWLIKNQKADGAGMMTVGILPGPYIYFYILAAKSLIPSLNQPLSGW